MQPVGALRRLDGAPAANIDDNLSVLSLWARDLGPLRVAFQFGDRLSSVLHQVRGLLTTDPASVPQSSVGKMIRKQETLVERMARICVVHNPLNAQFSTEEVLRAFGRIFESVDSGTRRRDMHYV
jgi:hypothetical protein